MEQRRSYRIDTFDPLLRDLLAWGLVERDPSAADDGWRLSADARRRLGELVQLSAPPAAEHMMYLDHRCTDCRQRGPTRLRDGEYLCQRCAERRAAAVEAHAPEQAGSVARPSKRGRLRRATERSKPLAG